MSSHFSARGQRLAFALIAVVELALFYLDARTIMHVHTPLDGRFQYLAGRVRNLEDLRHSGNIYQQFSAEAFTYPRVPSSFFGHCNGSRRQREICSGP